MFPLPPRPVVYFSDLIVGVTKSSAPLLAARLSFPKLPNDCRLAIDYMETQIVSCESSKESRCGAKIGYAALILHTTRNATSQRSTQGYSGRDVMQFLAAMTAVSLPGRREMEILPAPPRPERIPRDGESVREAIAKM
jgi:hypothetical protein